MARDKAERVKRGEGGKSARAGQRPPFCTISTTLFATRRMRNLDGLGVRLLLWLEAGWTPNKNVVLPQQHIATKLGVRRSRIASATARLLEAGLITLVSEAVTPRTPRSMGSTGGGKAAVYDLPHRRLGGINRLDQGDKSCQGYVKLWASDARQLAVDLSDAAARVAVIALAVPRSQDGTPSNQESLNLSGDQLEHDLPGLPARTAYRGVGELLANNLLTITRPHAGRLGARYAPAGKFVTRIPRKSARRR